MTESRPHPKNARLAGVQLISGTTVKDNLAAAETLLAQAADAGAQIVSLPEYFPIIGGSDAAVAATSETFGNGPIQEWLQEMAARYDFWLFGGSIPLTATKAGRIYNSTLVINPKGEVVARYDKLHLFAYDNGKEHYDEAESIMPGKAPVAVDTPFGRIGLSICYDLRFPELYRRLGDPDLILVPAAFTDTTGRAHWEILLRARAIENQCYLLAAAQGGKHPTGRRTHGNSMIVDPWGEIIDRKGSGSGLVVADLDHKRIRQIRAQLPALSHRVLGSGIK
ncbi:MAG: carbon-nitrogen hydrolase family protein [Zoogloeaceae bacterium]|jgi:nitrilase|nr:carbon-nitrogen hydrolase family protein [Zoogloeaceae bacterium]